MLWVEGVLLLRDKATGERQGEDFYQPLGVGMLKPTNEYETTKLVTPGR